MMPHVEAQRDRYWHRLELGQQILAAFDVEAPLPGGGFYLWARAPRDDAWALTERMAREAGALISPGEFYGASGAPYVRMAMVQPEDRLALVVERISGRK